MDTLYGGLLTSVVIGVGTMKYDDYYVVSNNKGSLWLMVVKEFPDLWTYGEPGERRVVRVCTRQGFGSPRWRIYTRHRKFQSGREDGHGDYWVRGVTL